MMTWDEKIKDFETFLKFERNFSQNTIDAYLRDIKKLKEYAEVDLENTGPLTITYENIQEYLFQLSKKKFSTMFGHEINDALGKELMLLKFAKAIHENKESITTTNYGDYLFLVMMKEFYMGMDRIRNEARKKLTL